MSVILFFHDYLFKLFIDLITYILSIDSRIYIGMGMEDGMGGGAEEKDK